MDVYCSGLQLKEVRFSGKSCTKALRQSRMNNATWSCKELQSQSQHDYTVESHERVGGTVGPGKVSGPGKPQG